VTLRARADCVKEQSNYSALGVEHNQQFDGKWVRGEKGGDDRLLGAPEISSLADLGGGAYGVLDDMKPIPFGACDRGPVADGTSGAPDGKTEAARVARGGRVRSAPRRRVRLPAGFGGRMAARMDFREEIGGNDAREFKLSKILHIEGEDGPDVALI
jgi:hypothetical protein